MSFWPLLFASGGKSRPIVSSVTPNTAVAYLGSTPLVIRGSNFTGATGVTIGGVVCTSVTVVSDTEIHCVAGVYP